MAQEFVPRSEHDELKERVDRMENDLKEVKDTLINYMSNKKNGGSTRTTEKIKGNATTKVTVAASSSDDKTKETKAKTTKATKASDKKQPINRWIIDKYAESHKDSILATLKISQEVLNEKYKANYEDEKHKAKDATAQLKAEASWIYKDYVQTNNDNKTIIAEFRKKVDDGEYSSNKVEENSSDE